MPTLHIFRGLPGSGKSTAARKLAAETGAILIEPDMLCIEDGRYNYEWMSYKEAQKTALMIVCMASFRGCDIIYADVMPERLDVVNVANATNLSGCYYQVKIHDLKITPEESKLRNRHNVRPEDIYRMAQEWEDWE